MPQDPYFTAGLIGMALILIAFLLNQLNYWKKEMLSYDLTNAIGSGLLLAYAWSDQLWPFVVLNAVWMLYSLKDVVGDLSSTPVAGTTSIPKPLPPEEEGVERS